VVAGGAHPTRPGRVISAHRVLLDETLEVRVRLEFGDGALRVSTTGRPRAELRKHTSAREVLCQLHRCRMTQQESLALASMARDDSPASSTAPPAARQPQCTVK